MQPKRRSKRSPKPDGAKRRTKCSPVEKECRIHEVFTLRIGGAELRDIVQYASEPERNWDVGERQLWNYI